MAIDIQQFDVTKLENFSFNLKHLYSSKREDWWPERPTLMEDDIYQIECGCEQELIGKIDPDDTFHLMEIHMYGEGSSSFMDHVFDDVLKQSKGILKATILYENGEQYTLSVVDGTVNLEKIDISEMMNIDSFLSFVKSRKEVRLYNAIKNLIEEYRNLRD